MSDKPETLAEALARAMNLNHDMQADSLGLACEHGMLARACEVCELQTEVARLTAELEHERTRIRELAESPPMASISLCCGIVRPGRYEEGAMHNGLCRGRHGGELGKTYYLHDVSALLLGRGEGGNDG